MEVLASDCAVAFQWKVSEGINDYALYCTMRGFSFAAMFTELIKIGTTYTYIRSITEVIEMY